MNFLRSVSRYSKTWSAWRSERAHNRGGACTHQVEHSLAILFHVLDCEEAGGALGGNVSGQWAGGEGSARRAQAHNPRPRCWPTAR